MRKSAIVTVQYIVLAGLFVSCASPLPVADPSLPATLGQEYAYELYTHCGVRTAIFDGDRKWRANPPIHDGAHNPTEGWGNPRTKGVMVLVREDLAVFTAESGEVAEFVPLPLDHKPKQSELCL